MVYGYIILHKETVGHGMPYWDEYYETQEITKKEVKLFSTKEERDKNQCNYSGGATYGVEVEVIPFETEGELK